MTQNLKLWVGQLSQDVVELAKKKQLDFELKPEDAIELLQSPENNLKRWEVSSYEWVEKIISWDRTYSQGRCSGKSWKPSQT